MRSVVFEALLEAARSGEPVALAVISDVRGSSPQKTGSKAVFYPDGRLKGTVGGGCLEAEVQRRSLQCLRSGKPELFDLVLDHDFGWDDGLICGGRVNGLVIPNAQAAGEGFWSRLCQVQSELSWGVTERFRISDTGAAPDAHWLYRETIYGPCALWVAGAGHIAQAVAPLAAQLDFEVTVFDDRPALASPQYFPANIKLHSAVWEQMLRLPLPANPAFGLIVTRGHRHDALVLKEWIHKGFVFLGMIGSARKARTVFEHFETERLATPAELDQVACPVGIRIRSQTVQEIAISILAQYIDKRAELVYASRSDANGSQQARCPAAAEDTD